MNIMKVKMTVREEEWMGDEDWGNERERHALWSESIERRIRVMVQNSKRQRLNIQRRHKATHSQIEKRFSLLFIHNKARGSGSWKDDCGKLKECFRLIFPLEWLNCEGSLLALGKVANNLEVLHSCISSSNAPDSRWHLSRVSLISWQHFPAKVHWRLARASLSHHHVIISSVQHERTASRNHQRDQPLWRSFIATSKCPWNIKQL
jgi:hypothetical protein